MSSIALDSTPGLDHAIEFKPDFTVLKIRLRAGEEVQVETSAMAAHDTTLVMKTRLRGGLLRSLGRGLGGESVLVNTFRAEHGPGELVVAPGQMGDIVHHRLGAVPVLLQRGAFVASSSEVSVTGKWAGFRGFFSGEGLVLLRATGQGDLFFNSYGAVIAIDVTDDYIVDTGYVVAFEDSLDYEVSVMPGLGIGQKVKSFVFGGEGLVCRFRGQGRLWIQTRAVAPFIRFVHPFRPVKNNS